MYEDGAQLSLLLIGFEALLRHLGEPVHVDNGGFRLRDIDQVLIGEFIPRAARDLERNDHHRAQIIQSEIAFLPSQHLDRGFLSHGAGEAGSVLFSPHLCRDISAMMITQAAMRTVIARRLSGATTS